jgi:ADP-heptose:LPS heptosyltransferase
MKHVLVVRLDSDGDVLLSGPAVRAIAASASRVTYLAGPRGRHAANLLPEVDEVLVHRAAWIDPGGPSVDRGQVFGLVDEIARRRVDEAFVLTSFHQSPLPGALLLRLAGVPVVAATSVDFPGSLLDVRHSISDDVHEVERSLSLVDTLGYRLPACNGERLAIKRPLYGRISLPAPYVVVHPGASVPARAWGAERNAALVSELVSRGRRVVVTGGPGETWLTARVAGERRPGVLDLGGRTTLAELAEVLAEADAVVVGNTGPAHLAAAVGTPVVSLLAPVVPAVRWRPWGVPHAVLGDQDAPCANSRARVCPVPGHPCLSCVSTAEAADALEELARSRGREVVQA